MKTQEVFTEFKSIAENLVHKIKEEFTDVKSKWAPVEEEAIQRFEELKADFNETLTAIDKTLQEWKAGSREEADAIRLKIDELRVQLSLGKAEGMEAFEEQKKKISAEWSLLKMKLEQHPEFPKMEQALKQKFMDWRIRLDMLKIQFSLGKMELKDGWKNISSEIGKEAEHLGKAVEAGAGIAGEKLDQFEIEIRKIFDKFK